MPARISDHSGFTLVEVLVSLACMAIAFVALWGVHYASLQTDVRTDLETGAVAAANSQLDYLRSLSFTDAMLADGNHTTNAGDPPLSVPFTRSHRVDPTEFTWKKNITVYVWWFERTGAFGGVKATVRRTVQMSSIIVNLN